MLSGTRSHSTLGASQSHLSERDDRASQSFESDFLSPMARVSNILAILFTVVLFTGAEYLYMVFGSVPLDSFRGGMSYGDPSQSLLEQRVNKTLEAFMKSMTENNMKNVDLAVLLEKLKVVEESLQTPVQNAKKEDVATVQEQLTLLDERIRRHEKESLKMDDLTELKEQLSFAERLIHMSGGFNATELREAVQAHEGTSAEKQDLESLREFIFAVDQKVQSITDAHIASLGHPFRSSEAFYGLNNQTFCVPWEINMDKWWVHHVDWSVSKENETHQCFSQMDDPEKADFFRKLYDIQFHGNCSTVFTKLMWNSGFGADIRNVVDGLQEAVKTGRPMEVFTAKPWHYAYASPSRSVCPSNDYRCYFLRLSHCQPNSGSYSGNLLNPKLHLDKNPGSWYYEFVTRQQTWLRQKVLRFSSKINIATPCTVVHVRRADIVLHKNRIRRYHKINDYVERMDKDTKNIFLLTDDDNAIGEALTKFPNYTWTYIDRPRHKGAEGGFENQIPSKNPKFEVIVLLSIFQLVKKCSTLIHTKSGFALLLRRQMGQQGGLKTVNIDLGGPAYSNEYALTRNISKEYPIPYA